MTLFACDIDLILHGYDIIVFLIDRCCSFSFLYCYCFIVRTRDINPSIIICIVKSLWIRNQKSCCLILLLNKTFLMNVKMFELLLLCIINAFCRVCERRCHNISLMPDGVRQPSYCIRHRVISQNVTLGKMISNSAFGLVRYHIPRVNILRYHTLYNAIIIRYINRTISFVCIQ